MYFDIETWFDPEKNSSSHYKLWNGSEVKAVASSKDALRGYTPSVIVVDEAAFIEGNKGEEFYTAAQPSLSTGGRSILISTLDYIPRSISILTLETIWN